MELSIAEKLRMLLAEAGYPQAQVFEYPNGHTYVWHAVYPEDVEAGAPPGYVVDRAYRVLGL